MLQCDLKQIGRQLAQEATRQAASLHLDELTLTIFHHSMTREEAYFVAEMAREVGSEVAGKVLSLTFASSVISHNVCQFINNGLGFIADILNDVSVTSQTDSLSGCVRRAGEILRILTHLAQPLWAEASLLPLLEPATQDKFFNALCKKFGDIESILSTNETDSLDKSAHSTVTQAVIFLARLLQFNLGFRGAWTAEAKAASSELTSTIFKLAVVRIFPHIQ